MTQLTLELSQLEVEPIDLHEVGTSSLLQEQDRNLETLTTTEGKNDALVILTLAGPLPVNGCGACCCTYFCCSNGACFCGE
jgi:hypothetical protein